MEVLLQSRNRHDAGMRVLQMQARLFRLDRPRFHQDYAGDDLQAVDDPVLQLLEQHILLPQQRLLFALQRALPRDVLHAEQNGRLGASLIEHLPRIQAHRPVPGTGKLFFDVIVLHHAMLGYDFFQQQSKLWNVPLTVAQFVEQPALGVPGCHLEERIKRAARGYHAQRLVENQDGLADSVDNGLGERTRVCGVDELLSETVEFHKTSSRPLRTSEPSICPPAGAHCLGRPNAWETPGLCAYRANRRARAVKSSDDPNESRLGLTPEYSLYNIDHVSRESTRAARRGSPQHQ